MLYGLSYLDWHAPIFTPIPGIDLFSTPPAQGPTCGGQSTGQPISYKTGLEIIAEVDLRIACNRGGILIERVYRSLSTTNGPFGVGTSHNYGYRLDTATPQDAELVNLRMPNGALVPLAKPNASAPPEAGRDAQFVNNTSPGFINSVLTTNTDGESTYRWKNGRIFRFTPDPAMGVSHLTSITDAKGNTITLHRNTARPFEISQIEDAVGRKVNLQYDGNQRITKITDPIGREVTYTYSGSMLASVTDPEGGVTRFEYDGTRLLREFDTRNVKLMENEYDANGRVFRQTLADGGIITLDYTLSNPSVGISSVRETKVTDAMGNSITYRFNPLGYLLSVVDPVGQTTEFIRAPVTNRLLSIKRNALCAACGDPGAGDVTFQYDAKGNLTSQTDTLGNTTQMSYEALNNKIATITDSLGHISQFDYDTSGQLTQVTDALSNVSRLTYDEHGLLKESEDAAGFKQTISYDTFANATALTDALGQQTVTRHDAVSRPVEIVDALGQTTALEYDQLDRVIKLTDASGKITRFEYDAIGNRTAVIDARANRTEFTYNDMGYLTSRKDSRNISDSRLYNLNGNLTQFTDRNGAISQFQYDQHNRLTQAEYSDGAVVSYDYNARNRLAHVEDSQSGSFSFSYDALGRLSQSVGPTGTVTYAYSARGEMTQRQVVGQEAVTYTYDAVGNLLSTSTPSHGINFSYDNRHQLTQLSRSNGVDTNYQYDEIGRLLNITHQRGTTVFDQQTYQYNIVNNRVSNSSGFNQAQMTQAKTSSVAVDSNRLTQMGTISYSYDENGNRSSETDSASGITTTYHWDGRNRLARISRDNGDEIIFRYDFAGNLIGQQSDTVAGFEDEQFVLDQYTNVVYRSSESGDNYSVLTGQGIDQHFALLRSTGGSQFALADGLNSTLATTDEAGSVEGQFFYENFGQQTLIDGEFPFRYTGRTRVNEGLYYYRARFYDSVAGRFISQDPIGFSGGDGNLYRYVGNGVLDYVDPTGHFMKQLWKKLNNTGNEAFKDLIDECSKTASCAKEADLGELPMLDKINDSYASPDKKYGALKDALNNNPGLARELKKLSKQLNNGCDDLF